ncbi:hypothetical protein BXZ70DRAFT_1005360 [Cristinia sonorae]|nr:hypothetical protein BXZ70DRAFT_1005360 [Cristinia sonorae]
MQDSSPIWETTVTWHDIDSTLCTGAFAQVKILQFGISIFGPRRDVAMCYYALSEATMNRLLPKFSKRSNARFPHFNPKDQIIDLDVKL